MLELCLDADRAGQEAMLRAAQLAAGRKLELRVVAAARGHGPAELIEREGAERAARARRARRCRSSSSTSSGSSTGRTPAARRGAIERSRSSRRC